MSKTYATGLVAALCAQLAIAAPTQPTTYKPQPYKPSHPYCHAVEQNANFDDLTGLPGIIFNPIPATGYKGLSFPGFGFTTVIALAPTSNLQPGVRPHSGTNYAAANLVTELGGTPMITTNFAESNTTSFTLESFYFAGVVQLLQGAAALPSDLNIQVTGYKGSDNSVSNAEQVCSQQFQYAPSTALGTVDMAFSGPVKDCKDINFAIFTFSLPGGATVLGPLSALLLDDIKLSTCSKE